jgi:hypothetical protein
MPFFRFCQNNSGGSFSLTNNLTHHVIVEAHDHIHANARFEELGGYFNGCADGLDCDCCGDRWSRVWKDDGEPEPIVYGKPPEPTSEPYMGIPTGRQIVVHYLDGTSKWF